MDRLTHFVSTVLGKMICGDHYIQPVNGIVGDTSCGFNTDMHLVRSLTVVLILGMVLYISSKKKS